MKTKIREVREASGYTQSELAELTNLSIRTIQRVESGKSIPKGHTLKVMAEALSLETSELLSSSTGEKINSEENLRIKLINLSTLCFIGIPFGNILIPFLIWGRKKDRPEVEEIIKRIINFQIAWTLCTCLLLIISPFLQDYFPENIVLILLVGLLAICVNLFFILKTAQSLSRSDYHVLPLKLRIL